MNIANVERGERSLAVTWADQSVTDFPYIWLRDNAPECFHPDAQERVFDLASVVAEVVPDAVESDTATLQICWPEQQAASVYDSGWLHHHRPGQRRDDPARVERSLWDAGTLPGIPRASAKACAESSMALVSALQELKRVGLLIVEELDDAPDAGEVFAGMIGFLRQTNFGVSGSIVRSRMPGMPQRGSPLLASSSSTIPSAVLLLPVLASRGRKKGD